MLTDTTRNTKNLTKITIRKIIEQNKQKTQFQTCISNSPDQNILETFLTDKYRRVFQTIKNEEWIENIKIKTSKKFRGITVYSICFIHKNQATLLS